MSLGAAVKELQDAVTVMAHLDKRQLEMLREHAEFISQHDQRLAEISEFQRRTDQNLAEITRLIDDGKLTTKVGAVLPLADAREAHLMLERVRPQPKGKIVIAIASS